ncbi:MAG: hypothetical protein EXQ50_08025 [Acidobacteria bacterium]|nr:hypothetical protein [Acidobacteriota bacterium]MSO62021.1 hypothetical protein [Acidobacteriota bacterium]
MTGAARSILLGIFLVGVGGISVELWLLGHYEELDQFIPLGLSVVGTITILAAAFKPTRITVRLLQAVMLLFVASGLVGVWFHFQATTEFQLEMDASLRGWALFRKAIVAKAPPALAPGAMIQLGLIGLAYTFKHPALRGLTPRGD